MVAVQNLKGEIIQLILSRKGGGMYLVSSTPPKRVADQNLKGEIIQLIPSRKVGGGWEGGMYLVSATPTKRLIGFL